MVPLAISSGRIFGWIVIPSPQGTIHELFSCRGEMSKSAALFRERNRHRIGSFPPDIHGAADCRRAMKIDLTMLRAAQNPVQDPAQFVRVILPLSLPGTLLEAVLCPEHQRFRGTHPPGGERLRMMTYLIYEQQLFWPTTCSRHSDRHPDGGLVSSDFGGLRVAALFGAGST
jgi:hypothetical protein